MTGTILFENGLSLIPGLSGMGSFHEAMQKKEHFTWGPQVWGSSRGWNASELGDFQ